MTDPIRAALDKAAAIDQAPTRHIAPEKHVAEIIAAFLRALPDRAVLALLSAEKDPHHGWRDTLADAVLAAAKENQK
jgi:hypothetical protein